MNQANKMTSTTSSIILISALCLIVCTLLATSNVKAMNIAEQIEQQQAGGGKSGVTLAVIENPELVVRVLDNLLRSVLYSASVDFQSSQNVIPQKRGLDLGISRGFSGSQAGKHLMGLSAASFANGPGRR